MQTVQELCATRLPKNMGIRACGYSGAFPDEKGRHGHESLKSCAASRPEPARDGKREKARDFSFREGDRVMQIRNNYDILWKRCDGLGAGTGIFNGDIGTIARIDFEAELVTIDFDDRRAGIQLRHALRARARICDDSAQEPGQRVPGA